MTRLLLRHHEFASRAKPSGFESVPADGRALHRIDLASNLRILSAKASIESLSPAGFTGTGTGALPRPTLRLIPITDREVAPPPQETGRCGRVPATDQRGVSPFNNAAPALRECAIPLLEGFTR